MSYVYTVLATVVVTVVLDRLFGTSALNLIEKNLLAFKTEALAKIDLHIKK